ncbi:TatD family hydrolase [Methanothermococcus okinawensis]|uniref:TatD-related deoxyribonuclease n=1 Tax=Methanothermococcus okinawensis (strain DSM 14208 / JCM 11175 / IH1) TaxID=647113 RepID=F8AME0_METOI|nr:TatD family hydrolase [Methanothermococcus okinawensis]AEH06833.1 TatD-related deoxyribonuclease [Methanothermococcus okinawensis IH1]
MENIKDIPITDNHIHVDDINGYGAEKVAKIFKNAGGKVMIVLNKPAFDGNLKKPMDVLLKDIETINKNVDDVRAYGLVGAHPAELTVMVNNGIALNDAKNRMIDALNYAKELVEKNDYLVGIGEVGRPHYPVNDEIWEASNEILLYAMELAKDLDCAIQIHAESASENQFKEFRDMAKSVNLNPERVIKHHCGDMVLEGEKYGIFPSIVASKPVVEAVKKSLRFVMETDYIDDLKRPGVVLGIKTVPRRTRKLMDLGLLDEEGAHIIHKENIEKLYNIELD